MGGWAPTPPTVAGEKRFVPYLSDPSLLDDPAERAAAARGTTAAEDDVEGSIGTFTDDAPATEDAALAAPRTSRHQGPVTSWTKAVILTAAIVVIGAFAWYAAQRFVGPKQWVVKFSIVAWLIGMGTACAMTGAGRLGAAAKIFAALTAILAIVLGKALILCHPDLPPELTATAADPAALARAFGRLAFKPIDVLFAALAIMGSALRFILSERD